MACGNIAYRRYHNGIDNANIVGITLERMRCAVTREEIRIALENQYRTPVEDFVIVPSKPSAMGNCLRIAMETEEAKTGKYGKVKAFRSICVELKKPVNLPDSRWAVENWHRFLEFVDTYNRLPERGWAQSDPIGYLK